MPSADAVIDNSTTPLHIEPVWAEIWWEWRQKKKIAIRPEYLRWMCSLTIYQYPFQMRDGAVKNVSIRECRIQFY